MTKILVITVGGSCEPIVNAVKANKYDLVFFVCSTGGRLGSDRTVDGGGNPCKKDKEDNVGTPSIVVQTGLKNDQYEKILLEQHELDDLNLAYTRIKELGKLITNKFPDSEVTANFTGGTKTMSACLVMAAIVFDWKLELNQGVRSDLVKVTTGDTAVPVSVEGLLEDRYISLVEKALDSHDYSMAAAISMEFVKKIKDARLRAKWFQLKNLSEGFSLWDAFLYNDALSFFESQPQMTSSWLKTLRNLTYTEKQGYGYHIVYDLINNAERRAHQGRYDDAVSRLYRATELLAQTRLKEAYGLESGNLDIKAIRKILPESTPETIYKEYEKQKDGDGIIRLGLKNTFLLLAQANDQVGRLFKEQENRISDILRTRNYSFLAHGLTPVGRQNYERVNSVLCSFLRDAIQKVAPGLKMPAQFPGRKLFYMCFTV